MWLVVDHFEQAGELAGRDRRKNHADAASREALGASSWARQLARSSPHTLARRSHGTRGRCGSWAEKIDPDLLLDASRVRREEEHPVTHGDRLLDVVCDEKHAFDPEPAFAPEIDELAAQRFPVRTSSAENGSSRSNTLGWTTSARRSRRVAAFRPRAPSGTPTRSRRGPPGRWPRARAAASPRPRARAARDRTRRSGAR